MPEILSAHEIERARSMLIKAARVEERGYTAVAERVGIKRSMASMFCNRRYPCGESSVARKVLKALDCFTCPYTQQPISLIDCHATSQAEAPTHNPMKLMHWQACLNCPGRPQATMTKES